MQAIPIHEAKANLSKYIAAAKKGEKVYIGGYGKAEVMLVVAPKPKVKSLWGMFPNLYISDEEWDKASAEVNQDFEDALNKDDL